MKALMGPSPYDRIMDDFICVLVCVSFSVSYKFLKIIIILYQKKYFDKVANNG